VAQGCPLLRIDAPAVQAQLLEARRAVMACVNAGKPHPWLVWRGGDQVTLAYHSTPAEPAGSNR
jgi:hypothetical protein